MSNQISKTGLHNLVLKIKSKGLKFKITLAIISSLLLFSAVPYFLGSGLTTPQPMGAYLNGTFLPLSTATAEPYRLAYPNLSFFYPITFNEIPSRNKIIIGQLNGIIYSFDNNEEIGDKDLLLDLSDDVGLVSDGGFLGLTVHPDFDATTNPKNYIYVYYATKNEDGEDSPPFGQFTIQNCEHYEYEGNFLMLERFEVNSAAMTIDPSSRTIIMKNRMYGTGHRGGGLDFGDDGFLYLSIGDQTSWNNAQNITDDIDGGVIRIDVDKDSTKSHAPIRKKPADGFPDEITGEEYWIPNDNPFLSSNGSSFEEYYSIGLRNPHRMTKDANTGTFYIGDVGLDSNEEINVLGYGNNYGWPLWEGNDAGPGCVTELLNDSIHAAPLVAFPATEANSITGGFVYRGTEMPEHAGKYLCADFGDGDEMWSVDTTTGAYELIGNFTPGGIISFGQDSNSELYLLPEGNNTPIYKMKSASASYDLFPQTLDSTGIFTDMTTLEVADGIVPYDLVESFWSDGAIKKRWMAIPNDGTHDTDAEQIEYSENGDWTFPIGSVLIKHFDLPVDDTDSSITKKIETRLSIMGSDGNFYYLTYNWNEAQTDAILQEEGLDETVTIATVGGGTRTQTWHFPSNTDCKTCHNNVVSGALGLKARYLNSDYDYTENGGTTANQLVTLSHLGILDETIEDTDTPEILTSKSIYDSSATLDEKARSYLDLNCAYCHRPETGNRANFDLRLFNSLETTNILNAGILSPLHNYPDEAIIYPGDSLKSILYHRMNSIDPTVMMPSLSKNIIDQDAVDLIGLWIDQLEAPTATINTADTSINLALLPSATLDGSVTDGRGQPTDILYDPRIDDYYQRTDHNEYGVADGQNLGLITIDDAFRWQVSWPSAKKINYITLGGVYRYQDQTETNWRISYRSNGTWTILDEGHGGWIDQGIFEWGSQFQMPIEADIVKFEAYSDGITPVTSVHLRARGGISNIGAPFTNGIDTDATPKASLIQYLPFPTECIFESVTAGEQTACSDIDTTYTQEVTVTYHNAPSDGNLVVNGQSFPVATSPQTVTLTELDSDGESQDVEVSFSNHTSCSIIIEDLFTAPINCTECRFETITAGAQTACNELDGTYTQEVTVAYVNEPTSGNLVVNGQSFPIAASPQTVMLTDLVSNGIGQDVEVSFSEEISCTLNVNNLYTAPANCNVGNPDNSPNSSINLGLASDAILSGTVTSGRGMPLDILYDPTLNNYRNVTNYNEYGVAYNFSLGTPNVDEGMKWQVNWTNAKYINYITFGGTYDNQSQPNTMWRISYHHNDTWTILEEGQGGWIDSGIYEWGGSDQQPFVADALRVQLYSDGTNIVKSIHLRGRGGTSNSEQDSTTTPKATLIQYIPLDNTCGITLATDDLLYCNGAWKDEIIPDETTGSDDLFIGNGIYTIEEDVAIEVDNLEVYADAVIVIKEGGSITVDGNLTNYGKIQLESTSTKYSSLIVEGTSIGNVVYKRHINTYNGVTGNDLVSSPVIGQNFGDFANDNPNIYENPSNIDQKAFAPFDEPNGVYVNYAITTDSDTIIENGIGFRAARDSTEVGVSSTTFTFTGQVETGDVSIPITETAGSSFRGWNLIGNPYPSYINFSEFFEDNKDQLNSNGAYQAIYGYNNNATNKWTIYNSLNTSKLIAPGQGFFIKSKSAGGTIVFEPNMRTYGSSDDFILYRSSSNNENEGYVKLQIDNQTSESYDTAIHFNENASLGLDAGYDAAMFGGNTTEFCINSYLVNDNTGDPIAIQALGTDDLADTTVPLGINAAQGQEVTVSISEFTLSNTTKVYLEDTLSNTFTLLNENDYTFTTLNTISGVGRFYLRFENEALNVSSPNFDTLKITTNQNDKTIEITGQLDKETLFKLYDIHGRVILTKDLEVSSMQQAINVSHLDTGIYIVELQSVSGERRIQKLIIN